MNRRLPVLLSALVLGAAVVYSLVQPSRPAAGQATASRRPLSCRFAPGEELAFRVRATSAARANQDGPPQQLSLEATLWWRVLEERSASGWLMAATLTDVQLLEGGAAPAEPARRAALEAPFLLQVDRDCRFRDFAFNASVDVEARRQVQGLLQAAEVILPPLRAQQWVSRHRDSLGAFDASYILESSAEDEAPQLSRQHGRYVPSSLPLLPAQLGGRMRVEVLASGTRATLDPQGRWVRELDGEERLKLWLGNKPLSEVASTVRVERWEGPSGAPAVLARVEPSRFSWDSASGPRAEPGLPPAPEPALAALKLDEVLATFARDLPEGSTNQGVHAATERLASYLSVHPEAVTELLARIRGGALPDRLHPMLFLALEKTGTLAAESGLATALADRGQGAHNRMRAAAALQDVPRPTERTAQALITQARADRSHAEEGQVADAALLALGALSHRTEARQPEVARMAREELEQRLRGARGPEEVSVALDAIGNSGDERFARTLEDYARDTSPVVRAASARAWRRMDSTTQAPALSQWLLQEEEPRVRRAIADALAERVHEEGRLAAPAVLSAAASRLTTEPDARTRASLIALLGSAAGQDAQARLALVQHFQREKVADLQVLIGRYVRADELR
ncbi:HEAT repeat domain-containing protein [Myxococcaceae bacterium GXIMD 01537]